MALGVYKYILRLQIPVGHSLSFVQELQYEYNLGAIELGCRLVKSTGPSQIAKYLASRAVVKLGMSTLNRERKVRNLPACITSRGLGNLTPGLL
jgi:hypothetical protein